MKKKIIVLVLTILFMAPAVSNAQLGNFIKNKVSKGLNAVGKEKANEADTAAKQKAETVDGANKPNEVGNENQSGQGGMDFTKFLGGKVDLKYNDEYKFTSRLYMVTESYDKKEVMKIDLYMYFSSNTPNVGMETKSITDKEGKSAPIASLMVMDGENKCFIILTDINGAKMGLISAIPDENAATGQATGKKVHKITPANFSKTGNSRMIAGFKCDEYSYTDQENKSTGKVWFTTDASLNIDKRVWQHTGMGAYYGYAGFKGGIILATEVYNEKGELTMKSETKEFNPNFSHSIAIGDYPLRQMNLNLDNPAKYVKIEWAFCFQINYFVRPEGPNLMEKLIIPIEWTNPKKPDGNNPLSPNLIRQRSARSIWNSSKYDPLHPKY